MIFRPISALLEILPPSEQDPESEQLQPERAGGFQDRGEGVAGRQRGARGPCQSGAT